MSERLVYTIFVISGLTILVLFRRWRRNKWINGFTIHAGREQLVFTPDRHLVYLTPIFVLVLIVVLKLTLDHIKTPIGAFHYMVAGLLVSYAFLFTWYIERKLVPIVSRPDSLQIGDWVIPAKHIESVAANVLPTGRNPTRVIEITLKAGVTPGGKQPYSLVRLHTSAHVVIETDYYLEKDKLRDVLLTRYGGR